MECEDLSSCNGAIYSNINNIKQELQNISCKLKCISASNNNNELIQLQINSINEYHKTLINKIDCANNRYIQILNEIDNLYLLVENNDDKITNFSHLEVTNKPIECSSCDKCIIFRSTESEHMFKYDGDSSVLFVTMIGGGGAGGVGYIEGIYYYSGGGGGAGACYVKKPIEINKGDTVIVKVGKGGVYNDFHGEDTYIKIVHINKKTTIVIARGGKNGHPYKYGDKMTNGGEGGVSLNKCFSGDNGMNGKITIPSQYAVCGGDGANSHYYNGGYGGGNYFNTGGEGGNSEILIGEDGKYGSGGGGSAPKFEIKDDAKISGNGGNGFVLIEWCL